MTASSSTIAVVSSSPALGSVLAATLAARRDWRIRRFETLGELRTYMRIAPVAAVVSDFELADGTVADFAESVRNASAPLAIVALSRTVTCEMRDRCLAAGVNEIIVKPMSPAHIEERVAAQLQRQHHVSPTSAPRYTGPERRSSMPFIDIASFGANVVSFAAHRAARRAGLPLGR